MSFNNYFYIALVLIYCKSMQYFFYYQLIFY